MRASRRIAPAIAFLGVLATASQALAYRPFDGTDADVAAHGEFELELGPIGYIYNVDGSALVLPAVVLNYGIFPTWELVIDSRHQLGLGDLHGARRSRILDNDILLKHVLREGTLQNDEEHHRTGISVATEFGPLLPELGGSHGVGVGVNLIGSYRFRDVTLHLNTMPQYDREHRVDMFESLIVEGPFRWTVRPVGEASVEKEWYGPHTESLLLGTIVRMSDDLYLDAAGRVFNIDGETGYEARLGFTLGVPIFEPAKTCPTPTAAEPEGERH
jgi:hypothetical protein